MPLKVRSILPEGAFWGTGRGRRRRGSPPAPASPRCTRALRAGAFKHRGARPGCESARGRRPAQLADKPPAAPPPPPRPRPARPPHVGRPRLRRGQGRLRRPRGARVRPRPGERRHLLLRLQAVSARGHHGQRSPAACHRGPPRGWAWARARATAFPPGGGPREHPRSRGVGGEGGAAPGLAPARPVPRRARLAPRAPGPARSPTPP